MRPYRCDVCDHPCSSQHGVKIHRSKSHKQSKPQEFKHTLADKAVQTEKLTAQQKARPTVHCEGEALKNVFKFKYLGTLFAANGLQCYDIDKRIATAKARCGKLRKIFDSKCICIVINNAVSFKNVWRYKRNYTDKTLTLRTIYEYVSERSERA